jgi:hypothetical protein
VDLLAGVGKGGGPGPAAETIRIEAAGDNALTVFRDDAEIQIGVANLDTGPSFAIGKDYYIYLNEDAVVISLNGTLPSRKIGGFHYGVNRRTTSARQPINPSGEVKGAGWEANIYNGIVPRSVWTDSHRPRCSPEGMVYLSSGVWADIYLSSDNGAGGLQSKHNILPVTGTEGLSWYGFTESLALTGKRLLSYNEWIQAAMGSPPGVAGNLNAWTHSSARQLTGFVERAVSSVGCRDCVGNVWEWLADLVASGSGGDIWQDPMPEQGFGHFWLTKADDIGALIAGGSYFNVTLAGSRTVGTMYAPWEAHHSFGARGACNSINN